MSARILHLIPQLGGGAGRAALSVACSTRGAELEVMLATLRPPHPGFLEQASVAGLELLVAPAAEELEDAIRASDVVHLHYWNSPELTELLERELPPARLLLWSHVAGNTAPQVIPSALLAGADAVVACTDGSQRGLLARAPAGTSVQVIPSVGGWDRIEDVRRSDRDGFNVGYIGKLSFNKMHPDFAKLCARIRAPDARFIVCGTGDAASRLSEQAKELGLADRFELLGQVEEIRAPLGDMDVFGYPLRSEDCAVGDLALMEAMYAGVPPVVLPRGGAEELVEDRRTGIVAGDLDAYVEAIERLHADPGERRLLGDAARETARARWTPELLVPAWRSAYTELMAQPKRSRGPILAPPPPGRAPGPARLLAGLGAEGEHFLTSANGTAEEAAEADRWIAGCSAAVGVSDGGILDHRRRYPEDPMLALWTGLYLARTGRPALAAGSLAQARRMGLPAERVKRLMRELAGAGSAA